MKSLSRIKFIYKKRKFFKKCNLEGSLLFNDFIAKKTYLVSYIQIKLKLIKY
jgi:hypothetical protein